MTNRPTTLDVLKVARRLLARGWVKNARAHDEFGRDCNASSSDAVAWSTLGAIESASGMLPSAKPPPAGLASGMLASAWPPPAGFIAAVAALDQELRGRSIAPTRGTWDGDWDYALHNIVDWGDDEEITLKEILGVLDSLIAKIEARVLAEEAL